MHCPSLVDTHAPRARSLLALWLLALWLRATPLAAQTYLCSATPEAAAAAAFTSSAAADLDSTRTGYRVQDVLVDALTRRVWLRVRRCDKDGAPALLVPMQASLGSPVASGEAVARGAAFSPGVSAGSPPRVIAVQPGDAIRVVMDGPTIHMEMEGRALQQAALGEPIEVELRRLHDEPSHRILGTLRADHRVEVQP